jgi:predicted NodU family carbamoyl transferase
MAQLILTAHSGSHDAGAALFEDNLLNCSPAGAAARERRKRIAAVAHVDGPSRPQIIERETMNAFERESGISGSVNTSFNVHEEPIVNKPSECIRGAT